MLLRIKSNDELFKRCRKVEEEFSTPFYMSTLIQNNVIVQKRRIDDFTESIKQYLKILKINYSKAEVNRYANCVNEVLRYIADLNKGKPITFEEFNIFRNCSCPCFSGQYESDDNILTYKAPRPDSIPILVHCSHSEMIWIDTSEGNCRMNICPFLKSEKKGWL